MSRWFLPWRGWKDVPPIIGIMLIVFGMWLYVDVGSWTFGVLAFLIGSVTLALTRDDD